MTHFAWWHLLAGGTVFLLVASMGAVPTLAMFLFCLENHQDGQHATWCDVRKK